MSLYQRLISTQLEKTAGLPRYLKNLQDVGAPLRRELRNSYRESAAGGDATSAYIAKKLDNALHGAHTQKLKATKISPRAARRNAKVDTTLVRDEHALMTPAKWNSLDKADYDVAFRKNNPVLLPGYGKPSVDPARPLAQFEPTARRLYREGRQAREKAFHAAENAKPLFINDLPAAGSFGPKTPNMVPDVSGLVSGVDRKIAGLNGATERMGAAAPKVPKKISDMSDAEILERLNRVAALTGKPVKPISQKELDGIRTSAARLQAGLPILPTKPTARQTEEAIQSRLAGERFDRRLKAYGGAIVAGGTLGSLAREISQGAATGRRVRAAALGVTGLGAGALGYSAYRANKR